MQSNKRVEDIMKSLEFKMLFFSKSANSCLSNKRTVSDCTNEATKGIKEMISSTKSIIDKIWFISTFAIAKTLKIKKIIISNNY